MKRIFGLRYILPILGLSLLGFATRTKPATATAYTFSIPVIKGLSSNPVIRVALAIPADGKSIDLKEIVCSINPEAIKDISKIEVFSTAAEPFSAENLVGSVTALSTSIRIPLKLKVEKGLQFLWISILLKDDASMKGKILVRAEKLVNSDGSAMLIKNSNQPKSLRQEIAVRKAGDNGVHTYRIPGIIQTDRKTLIAVYDIRYNNTRDLPGNIDVGMSRSTDGGRSWEPMKNIIDMGAPHENNGVGDPAILFDPVTKKIWVAALWSKGNRSIAGSQPGLSPDTTGQFVLVSSDDDGITWSQPHSITTQVKNSAWHLYFNGPGSGIAMKNGTLVFASQYWDETTKPAAVGIPHSSIIYSDDHGNTWKSGVGAKSNTTESQVVETTAGTLMLNMRDNRGKYRSVATTTDMGASWTEHASSYNALPDPVCQGSLIKASFNVKGVKKELFLFSNPNTSSGRYDMTIKASLDQGETWSGLNQLLIDERNCYGYSSLTKVDDNTVGLLYEGTRDLYFITIPIKEIVR